MASGAATCAAAHASTPSHITGAIAGAASRFAGNAASESCWKCKAISGAVPIVAAIVSAAASATGLGMRRSSRAFSGEAPTKQRRHRRERQLPPRFLDRPRVERERHRRREQQRVPALRGPPRQRRHQPGDPHHPGPLDRRPTARQRHVDRDQCRRQRADAPAAERRRARTPPSTSTASRITFGPDTARMCASPERWKSSRTSSVSRSSSPSTIPPQQRRLGRGEAAIEPGLGPAPHPVEQPREATPPLPGRRNASSDRSPRGRCACVDTRRRARAAPTRPRTGRCRRPARPPAARRGSAGRLARRCPGRRGGGRGRRTGRRCGREPARAGSLGSPACGRAIDASTPASSAVRRASATVEPVSTAAAASSAGHRRPAQAADTPAASRTTTALARPRSNPATSAARMTCRGCACRVARALSSAARKVRR